MSQKVFGDVDLSVHVARNPIMTNDKGHQYQYPGIVFQVNCQDCETPTKIALQWPEVRTLLEGGMLNGVTRSNDGWIIALQCQNSSEGCSQITQISITDEELQKHAEMEVTRRQRNAQTQNRMQMPQRAPQVARRPMVRR